MAVNSLLALGARTTDASSIIQIETPDAMYLIIEVTAIAATPSVTPKIRIENDLPAPSVFSEIWAATAAITATGTYVYYLTKEKSPTAASDDVTETAECHLAPAWELFMEAADTDSMTYSAAWIRAT